MQVFRIWRWSALAIAFGFATPVIRADKITPDSITNPPSAVSSANGTPVYASNLVSSQYVGSGLNFPSGGWAITRLDGVNVWAPTEMLVHPGGPSSNNLLGTISYDSTSKGTFVSTGSLNPTTISSLSVNVIGNAAVTAYGLHDQALNITPVIGSTANAQVWTFTGSGISGFSVSPANLPPPLADGGPWGVSGVSFTPATTPEPSSLVLAGLGALSLVARLGWRRTRRLAQPVEA